MGAVDPMYVLLGEDDLERLRKVRREYATAQASHRAAVNRGDQRLATREKLNMAKYRRAARQLLRAR